MGAVKFLEIKLSDGSKRYNCFIEPITAPPDFIAVSSLNKPKQLEFIKVKQIVSFSIDESDYSNLWEQFSPLPESV